MQDVNQFGDIIYRDAETVSLALKQARKDYSKVNFMVIGTYDYETNDIYFAEVLDFQNANA